MSLRSVNGLIIALGCLLASFVTTGNLYCQGNTLVRGPGSKLGGYHLEISGIDPLREFPVTQVPDAIQGRIFDVILLSCKAQKKPFHAAFALLDDGTVVAWGESQHGLSEVPEGLTDVVQLSGNFGAFGAWFMVALKSDGSCEIWGDQNFEVPRRGVVAMASGDRFLLTLDRNGKVDVNGPGPLQEAHDPPSQVRNIRKIDTIAGKHFVLDESGKVLHWMAGNSSGVSDSFPETLPPIREVALCMNAGAAITTEGKLFCWGKSNSTEYQALAPLAGSPVETVIGSKRNIAVRTPDGAWTHANLSHYEKAEMPLVYSRAIFAEEICAFLFRPDGATPVTSTPSDPATDSSPSPSEMSALSILKDPSIAAKLESFQAMWEVEAGAPFDRALGDLNKKYDLALEREEKQAISSGNLDAVTAIRAERKEIQEAGILDPEEKTRAEGSLQSLREVYFKQLATLEQKRDAATKLALEKWNADLKKVEVKLTQEEKIEEALQIRTLMESLPGWIEGGFEK